MDSRSVRLLGLTAPCFDHFPLVPFLVNSVCVNQGSGCSIVAGRRSRHPVGFSGHFKRRLAGVCPVVTGFRSASNLGVLLEQQGDLEDALGAYRRADARGDANGALNLGLVLAKLGDVSGAQAAYRRASERGDAEFADQARAGTVVGASPAARTCRRER